MNFHVNTFIHFHVQGVREVFWQSAALTEHTSKTSCKTLLCMRSEVMLHLRNVLSLRRKLLKHYTLDPYPMDSLAPFGDRIAAIGMKLYTRAI